MFVIHRRIDLRRFNAELMLNTQEPLDVLRPQRKKQNTEAILDLVNLKALYIVHLSKDTVGDVIPLDYGSLAPYLSHHFSIGETLFVDQLRYEPRFLGRFPFLYPGNMTKPEERIDIASMLQSDIRDCVKYLDWFVGAINQFKPLSRLFLPPKRLMKTHQCGYPSVPFDNN